jgi:hypothetical protein
MPQLKFCSKSLGTLFSQQVAEMWENAGYWISTAGKLCDKDGTSPLSGKFAPLAANTFGENAHMHRPRMTTLHL